MSLFKRKPKWRYSLDWGDNPDFKSVWITVTKDGTVVHRGRYSSPDPDCTFVTAYQVRGWGEQVVDNLRLADKK